MGIYEEFLMLEIVGIFPYFFSSFHKNQIETESFMTDRKMLDYFEGHHTRTNIRGNFISRKSKILVYGFRLLDLNF